MSAINKLMALDSEIDTVFADLQTISDRLTSCGFSYMLTASVYNTNKEYTNEINFNNISPEESRILLYMQSEEITKNQLQNLLIKK